MPVAFELARRLRKAPRAIAQELAAALGAIDGVARVDAAPNGYLNFFLDRAAFLRALARGRRDGAGRRRPARSSSSTRRSIRTRPRTSVTSATRRSATRSCALLRFQGRPVEVQNYIDDTGVQVADVVVGFTELEGQDLAAVRRSPTIRGRFDYYCWDLYARVTEWYAGDKARLEHRARAALHAIEHGGNALAEPWAPSSPTASSAATCGRWRGMNVDYDLLTWEGDILRLQFWATAFEELKARGAVFLQTEGRLAGCWVMPIEDGRPAEAAAAGEPDDDAEQREKVIVRSNGTVTYVGKDIANQFWKFGLLGKDFHYRVFDERDGTAALGDDLDAGRRTDGARVRPRDGRLQRHRLAAVVPAATAEAGARDDRASPSRPTQSTHFSYEMVALSHATARELGYARCRRATASRSSRCPAARAWASRPTTCSTG